MAPEFREAFFSLKPPVRTPNVQALGRSRRVRATVATMRTGVGAGVVLGGHASPRPYFADAPFPAQHRQARERVVERDWVADGDVASCCSVGVRGSAVEAEEVAGGAGG